jgi:hypothetical protein
MCRILDSVVDVVVRNFRDGPSGELNDGSGLLPHQMSADVS